MILTRSAIMNLRTQNGIDSGVDAWTDNTIKRLGIAKTEKTHGWIERYTGLIVDDKMYALALREKDMTARKLKRAAKKRAKNAKRGKLFLIVKAVV